jgi:multisubunit Na+/H+ antiporter MnhB subunit
VISQLLSLASSILFIVWAFKAKSALQEYALNTHKIDFRMKVFYTLIFNVYYINYCFNDLPESKRKQDILKGNTEG